MAAPGSWPRSLETTEVDVHDLMFPDSTLSDGQSKGPGHRRGPVVQGQDEVPKDDHPSDSSLRADLPAEVIEQYVESPSRTR